jgi:hypothetical protein
MDIIEFLRSFHIDPIVVVLIIAGGFFAKTYLGGLTHVRIGVKQANISVAWKTLIVGTWFSAMYIGILAAIGQFSKDIWLELFYSYVFATSFYELIINPFTKWINKKLGNDVQG